MGFLDDWNQATNSDTPLAAILKTNQHRAMPDVPEEDSRAYAAQKGVGAQPPSQGTGSPLLTGAPEYLRPSTGNLPTPGVDLARAVPRGTNVYNTYDIDRPASMGASANNPWQDMARQLATFSALRNRDPQTVGFASLPDYAAQQNADFDRRHAFDDVAMNKSNPDIQRALVAAYAQNNKIVSDDRAHDNEYALGMDRNRVAEMGHGLDYRARTEAADIAGKNQLTLADMHGRNHLAVAGLQGRNQLDNTRLHGLMSYMQALGLQDAKSEADATDPYRLAMAESAKQHGRYYQNLANGAAADSEYGKTPHGMMAKEIQMLPKLVEAGVIDQDTAKRRYAELQAAAYAHSVRKNNYADGGRVDPAEEILRRMQQKYGAPASVPQETAPPPQKQAPAPAQAPAAQQPQGILGILKGRQAQIDKASGYAEGGPIDVSGRQVLGAGTPKSDSLPAIIDGEHPAALSTNEFVMPDETVRYFGLAKLNKMVEQSRRGLDTSRKQA